MSPNDAPARTAQDPDVVRTLGLDRSASVRRVVWRLVLAALVLGALGGIAFGVKKAREPKPPAFVLAAARRSDVRVVVTATGTLRARNTVQVGTEVSGRVRAVHVSYNDRVTAGQVLVEIDPEQLEARVREARAQMAVARAALETAQATLAESSTTTARVERLFAAHLASQADVDAAHGARARATAQQESARAQEAVAAAGLSTATTMLGKAVIRAPIDGVVLDRLVEPGQTVNGSFQAAVLLQLADDLEHMEMRCDIDEADIGRVREGQGATFEVAAYPGREFPSTIVALHNAPRTVQNVVSYEGVLAVDNTARLLRPGMTATVSVLADRRDDVLVVPNAALRWEPSGDDAEDLKKRLGNGRHVWITEHGKPRPVAVMLGVTDGHVTELLSGDVHAGTQLIVDSRQP